MPASPYGFETDLLYLACLAALVLGGSGPLARSRGRRAPRARAAAVRHGGGIAMVEIIANATISVNRFLLNTPADRAIDATITSVEPRAFMARAGALWCESGHRATSALSLSSKSRSS
jgi:hypothetical protein